MCVYFAVVLCVLHIDPCNDKSLIPSATKFLLNNPYFSNWKAQWNLSDVWSQNKEMIEPASNGPLLKWCPNALRWLRSCWCPIFAVRDSSTSWVIISRLLKVINWIWTKTPSSMSGKRYAVISRKTSILEKENYIILAEFWLSK